MSSFSPRSHSWEDFHKAFEKLKFKFIEEDNNIRYYQDPDSAVQTLQKQDVLDRPYIDDKLDYIGFNYKVFRWLIID